MKNIKSVLRLFSTILLLIVGFNSISEAGLVKRQHFYSPKRCYHVKPQPRLLLGPEVSLLHNDSFEGWTNLAGKEPGNAWTMHDGVLHLKGKGGDIKTEKEYENFILDFTWTIAKGGNSGIKYRFKKFEGKGWLGLEYQVLDDFNTGEGKKSKNSTATLYDILPTNDRKQLNPHTEQNRGRIVVHDDQIEHWLNGKKVVDVKVGSDEWKEGIANSKFKNIEGFGENSLGFIMVQDHQCEVWFHNISIKEILGTTSGGKSMKKTMSCYNYRCGKTMRCKTVFVKKTSCKPSHYRTKCYKPACSKSVFRSCRNY